MKTFEVVLTKSYLVKIKTENEIRAKEFVELFTSDVKDVSTKYNRKKLKFEITGIECMMNESFDVKEVIEIDQNTFTVK
jgi:hypothetical protein